jgi:hypothetical protein
VLVLVLVLGMMRATVSVRALRFVLDMRIKPVRMVVMQQTTGRRGQ